MDILFVLREEDRCKMFDKHKLLLPHFKAVTLVELLVVMTIFTMSFFGFIEYMRSISYARLATNAARAAVNLVRSTKHQAMLLRRAPDDPWIFGTGIRIYKKDNRYWIIDRFRYIDSTGSIVGEIYKPYPQDPPKTGQLEAFESETQYTLRDKLILEPRIELKLFLQRQGSQNEVRCEVYYVIFESLKGITHFYCGDENQRITNIRDVEALYVVFEPGQSVLKVSTLGDIYLLPKSIAIKNAQ